MFRILALALTLGMSAMAADAQTLPAAYMYTSEQISDSNGYNFISQHHNDGNPFLAETYGFGAGLGIPEVDVYVDNFPLMTVSAYAVSSRYHVSAQGGISYAIGVLGPYTGATVPIQYSAYLQTSAPGSEAQGVVAVASAYLNIASGNTQFKYQAQTCSLSQYGCVAYPSSLFVNGVINVSVGTFISVYEAVSVEGGMGTSFNAKAFADPFFQIDPVFAQSHPGYSLTFSPNIQNSPPGGVPEPATWATMIAGFALVGGTLRRRPVRVQFA